MQINGASWKNAMANVFLQKTLLVSLYIYPYHLHLLFFVQNQNFFEWWFAAFLDEPNWTLFTIIEWYWKQEERNWKCKDIHVQGWWYWSGNLDLVSKFIFVSHNFNRFKLSNSSVNSLCNGKHMIVMYNSRFRDAFSIWNVAGIFNWCLVFLCSLKCIVVQAKDS